MRRRLSSWLPVVVWMGLIFSLSSQSSQPRLEDPLLNLLARKAYHLGVYAVLTLLLYRAQVGRVAASFDARAATLAFVVAVIYGATDELHQSFVANRGPSPVDVGIDAVGAILALVGIRALRRLAASRSSP